MGEELLHIRHSFQVEGQKRWEYWSAVRVTADGEEVIDSTQPLLEPAKPAYRGLELRKATEKPSVAAFEYENRLRLEHRQLVAQLQAQGWEPMEQDRDGRVVRMRRAQR